jgi:hypothetical protein
MANPHYSEELAHIARKVAVRVENISQCGGRVPAIEMDLALEDIRKMYDLCLLIRAFELKGKEEAVPERDSHLIGPGTLQHAEETAQMSPEPEIIAPKPAEETVRINPETEIITPKTAPAPLPEPEMVIPDITESSRNQVTQESKGKEISQQEGKKILGETLKKGGAQSINDLIAARFSDQSISGRMQHNPISNLKTAIGINEKFIFLNELFMGNMALYNEVIERLNTMPGRNEAIALMEELRSKYHWDIENMAFQKLIDMVTRRYS